MPNNRYLSGRRAEWLLRKQFTDTGAHVTRSAGSKGKFDLIVVREGQDPVLLVQVKSLKQAKQLVPTVRAWNADLLAPSACYRQELWVRLNGIWVDYRR